MAAWGPEILVHPSGPGAHLTPGHVEAVAPFAERCTAAVVGPGLGTHPETRAAAHQILALLADHDVPTVVDADGLDALDRALLRRHGARMVLTPHAREFQDLAGRPATAPEVVAYARRAGTTVLRKAAESVITDGRRTRRNRRGHPTLTVGGTGDVLAGATAQILAKGAQPFEAACAASYLVGSAGELAAALRSYGATATDLLEAIPAILLRLD